MFVFYYEIRNAFAEREIKGEVFADNKLDAMKQVKEEHRKELQTSMDLSKITLYEVA